MENNKVSGTAIVSLRSVASMGVVYLQYIISVNLISAYYRRKRVAKMLPVAHPSGEYLRGAQHALLCFASGYVRDSSVFDSKTAQFSIEITPIDESPTIPVQYGVCSD